MKRYLLMMASVIFLLMASPASAAYGSGQTGPDNDTISNVSFSLNADLVSRFIWRGLPLDLHTNIQPYASLTINNFTIGAWGSYGFSNNYAEADLFLSYDIGAFTLSVNDYYNEDEDDMSANDYFQFSDTDTTTTPHSLEGQVTFNATDRFPVSVTLATFFYGNDKNAEDKNYYSTYLELGYEHSIGENNLSYFLGGTFAEGYYASKAAIVNVGLTASRELRLSESTSLPVSASLILNPDARDIFFVFSLTF